MLDLRGNPGGLLNEGVEVAGHFLKKNDLVVSHRGRAQPNKNYYARTDNGGKQLSRGGGGEPLLGVGGGDRHRRVAGSRPRLDPGRNHFRQGPGADRVPAEREYRRWR